MRPKFYRPEFEQLSPNQWDSAYNQWFHYSLTETGVIKDDYVGTFTVQLVESMRLNTQLALHSLPDLRQGRVLLWWLLVTPVRHDQSLRSRLRNDRTARDNISRSKWVEIRVW